MSEAVITALIVAASSIICQVLINRKAREEDDIRRAVDQERIENRLDNLERKVDEHNGYAAKFTEYGEKYADTLLTLAKMQKDIEYIKESK